MLLVAENSVGRLLWAIEQGNKLSTEIALLNLM
jgi:hypothetical protein